MLRMTLNISWSAHLTNELPKVTEKMLQGRMETAHHCVKHQKNLNVNGLKAII